MYNLVLWILLILTVNVYAILKRDEGEKRAPIAITVFTLLLIIIIIPVILALVLVFALYRQIINVILKLKHGNLYKGLLQGFDVVHTVDEISNSKTSILTIFEYDHGTSSKCFFEIFQESMVMFKKPIFNKIPKFKCKYYKYNGYTYMVEDDIDINDCVRKMPLVESENEELSDFELAQLLKKSYNLDLPKNNTVYWDFLIGTQPIRKKSSNDKNSKWYPVLFRNHHCVSDGVSLLKFLVGVLADSQGANISTQSALNKTSVFDTINAHKITFEHVLQMIWKTLQQTWTYFCVFILTPSSIFTNLFLKANDDNFLHKTDLNGQSILAFYAEDDDTYFMKVKNIKRKIPGTSFPEILLAAYSQSLCNFFKKKTTACPKYITSVVPVVSGSSQLQHLVPGSVKLEDITFQNDYSLVLLDLPLFVKENDASVMQKLKFLKKEINILNNSVDYHVMYVIMNYILSVLPTRLIRVFLHNFHCTTSVSIVPGHVKAEYVNGALRLVDAGFWTPHLKNIGLGVSIFSYDGRLSFGISVDEALIDNYEEAQSLIEDVLCNIDLLEKEVDLSVLCTKKL